MIKAIRWFLERGRKEEYDDCEWLDSCKCNALDKTDYCGKCRFYFQVDSGYGYCRALPGFVLVAWCRDVCSLYRGVKDDKGEDSRTVC